MMRAAGNYKRVRYEGMGGYFGISGKASEGGGLWANHVRCSMRAFAQRAVGGKGRVAKVAKYSVCLESREKGTGKEMNPGCG